MSHQRFAAVILCLVVVNLCVAPGASALTPAEEKELLLAFKEKQNSGVLSTWTADSDMCSQWSGVTCANGHVTRLYLYNNQLTGTLPPQWSAMTSLDELSLRNNELTGTLPPQWSAMTSMDELELSYNGLTGTLPPQWSTMTSMDELWLNDNGLTGTLPPQWNTMTSLERLGLNDNGLTGTLPPQWNTMTSLRVLQLHYNKLTGTLPPQWSAMTSMDTLFLQHNELTGTIPPQWSAMTSLDWLDLRYNKLTGTLPPQWSAMTSLWHLDLRYNYLVDGVPSGIRGTVEYSPQYDPPTNTPPPPPSWSQPLEGAPSALIIGVAVASAVVVAGAAVAGYIWYRRRRVALRTVAPSDADGGNNAGANPVFPSSGTHKPMSRVEEDAESLIRHHSVGETEATSDPVTRQQAWGAATNNAVFASASSGAKAQVPAAPGSALASTPLQQATGANDSASTKIPSAPGGGAEGQAGKPPNDIDSAHVAGMQTGKPTSERSTAPSAPPGFDTQISAESLELVRALDEGSFGAVYHMRMNPLGSDVAVKVVPVDGPRAQRNILKEVEMLRRMSNPNVVQYFGTALATNDQLSRLLKTSNVGSSKQSVLLVTELARFGSLYDFYFQNEDEYVKPWLHRVDLGKQIAAGVHYLHSQTPPVLHCDLKSKNVLLKGEEGRMIAKLCDFGQSLSAATQSRRSTLPSFRGTLAWCAPEVLGTAKPEYTQQTDMYSLGMTLYELVALEPPFDGAMDVLGLAKSGVRPDIPEGTPAAFRTIVEDCWHQDPAHRPTAAEVCRRLAALSDELEVDDAVSDEGVCKVLLSHNWGPGNANHARVARVYHSLGRNGVKCWFDEDDMVAGNILEKMARGIDESRGFLAFITEEYRDKVNGENDSDNCKYEFNYACLMKRDKMQAVVLEPSMMDPKGWGGTLGAALGVRLYTDMCDLDRWDDAKLDTEVKNRLMPQLRKLGIL